jgi:beta-lactamase class A
MNISAMMTRPRLPTAIALAVLLCGTTAGAVDLATLASQSDRQTGDPVRERMRLLERTPYADDPAPLWTYNDGEIQARLDRAIERLGLAQARRHEKLAVALVDITEPSRPRVATANGDLMMYAASLPKIAILLGAYEKASLGLLRIDPALQQKIDLMIQRSSNTAATDVMKTVGREYIASVLMSPRYRLYDPLHNGGLWVGKDYANSTAWKRDPLHNVSHGATAMQVARFYYMLSRGKLVSPYYSRRMLDVLGHTEIETKFAKGILSVDPEPTIFRKSGSWGTFNSDSAIVHRDDGKSYIAVALSDDRAGADWLARLIVELDHIIAELPAVQLASAPAPVPAQDAARRRGWWQSPGVAVRAPQEPAWPRRKTR